MNITIAGDDALAKFVRLLEQAGKGKARQAMARALNSEGEKGRTQIRRKLVQQSGLKYGGVAKKMTTKRAHAGSLAYEIRVSGIETNLSEFDARWLRPGVRASPWGRSRVFLGSFLVPARGQKVFVRETVERFPIRPLHGPNLAREAVRPNEPARQAFEAIAPKLEPAILRVVAREFGL